MRRTRVIVGGVSGSGKSTVGSALAERLGVEFVDGDDLHPEANVEKMRAGTPLTDEDRAPWLRAIGDWLAENDGVVACSALRRAYRDLVRERAAGVDTILLHGDPELIRARQAARGQHFMPPALMDSQFALFEPIGPDEAGTTLDVVADVATLVEQAVAALEVPDPA
jgi:gluconokinase